MTGRPYQRCDTHDTWAEYERGTTQCWAATGSEPCKIVGTHFDRSRNSEKTGAMRVKQK